MLKYNENLRRQWIDQKLTLQPQMMFTSSLQLWQNVSQGQIFSWGPYVHKCMYENNAKNCLSTLALPFWGWGCLSYQAINLNWILLDERAGAVQRGNPLKPNSSRYISEVNFVTSYLSNPSATGRIQLEVKFLGEKPATHEYIDKSRVKKMLALHVHSPLGRCLKHQPMYLNLLLLDKKTGVPEAKLFSVSAGSGLPSLKFLRILLYDLTKVAIFTRNG